MQSILDILNQPIVLTLVTITFGSYLLSVVANRRTRKIKLRDEGIRFLQETSDHINKIFPLIYRNLRKGEIKVDSQLEDGLTDLFSKRISIQVGSQAYLESDNFHTQYFFLLDQIAAVIVYMAEYEKENNDQIVGRIKQRRVQLSEHWSIEDEVLILEPLVPVDEFIAWMDMIMLRTTKLLSSHLEAALR